MQGGEITFHRWCFKDRVDGVRHKSPKYEDKLLIYKGKKTVKKHSMDYLSEILYKVYTDA